MWFSSFYMLIYERKGNSIFIYSLAYGRHTLKKTAIDKPFFVTKLIRFDKKTTHNDLYGFISLLQSS